MDVIEPVCPHCSTTFRQPAELAGGTFKCPTCGDDVQTIKVTGRTDFHNSGLSREDQERAARSLAAGFSTGFRQFKAPEKP